MDIEMLKYFLDIRKSGSISNAANHHYITQSALSKKIALLEKELGIKLFLRGKGKGQISLTPAGKSFTDIAERMLLLYKQALELKAEDGLNFITIACIRSAHDYVLPRLLNDIDEHHPDFRISIEDHHTVEIISLLENHRVDLGIVQAAAPYSNFVSELLYEEDYRVVMKKSDTHQKNPVIHPDQLLPAHGIFQSFDQEFQDWYEEWWGFFSAKIRVNTTPTAEQYFTDKDDWMIVPTIVAREMEKRDFSSYALHPEAQVPRHRIFLIYNKKANHTALQDFLLVLKAAIHRCGITNL